MNLLKFGSKVLYSKVTGRQIPLQVNIHLLDRCNLRCRYCYIDFDNPYKDLTLDQLKKLLMEIKELGGERISLEGGEPLLRRDIGQIVDFIDDLGMDTNINTNGFFVPQKIDKIKRAKMLTISLDGDQEAHDKSRGEGSFAKAINAAKIAKSAGLAIHLGTVLNKANMKSIDFLIDLANENGFSLVPFSLFYSPGFDFKQENVDQYAIDDDEYRDLLDHLIALKKSGAPIAWSVPTLEYAKSWPTTYRQSSMPDPESYPHWSNLECKAGVNFCVIQTNGDLYTCDPLLGDSNRANALELGFKEALRRIQANKQCKACNSLVCTEYHQMFAMKPRVIANLLKNYKGHGATQNAPAQEPALSDAGQ